MDRQLLKLQIVEHVKGMVPPFKVAKTLEGVFSAIKSAPVYDADDLKDWAESMFSVPQQDRMMAFAIAYGEVVEAERAEVERRVDELLEEISAKFDEDRIDSSGLPWLSGSPKQSAWGMKLRSEWIRCVALSDFAEAREEVLSQTSAKYWIEKLKGDVR